MTNELRYWRDLPKEAKDQIKKDHNIKFITYKFIQTLYLESI